MMLKKLKLSSFTRPTRPLELTPKRVIIRDWNEKVRSQEISGATGKSGLGVKMK